MKRSTDIAKHNRTTKIYQHKTETAEPVIFSKSLWVESAETSFITDSDVADHDGAVDIPVSPIFSEISTF